jgi:hypothetical protein
VVSAGDEDLVERAVECLLEDLDDDAAFQRLTPEERAATLAWVLVGLVGNGGFEAWVESVGQRTPDAVVGLRLLGADAHAVLLEQVARLYPTAGAADAGTRLSAMDAWGDREVSHIAAQLSGWCRRRSSSRNSGRRRLSRVVAKLAAVSPRPEVSDGHIVPGRLRLRRPRPADVVLVRGAALPGPRAA